MKQAMCMFLTLGALLVGCQGPEGTSVAKGTKIPLKVLYAADTSAAGYATEASLWAAFQTSNPDIDLQFEPRSSTVKYLGDGKTPDGLDYNTKLAAYITVDQVPDVFSLWPSRLNASASVYDNHLAKDLSTILPADLLSNYPAILRNPARFPSGQLSELPQSFTFTSVVYANLKLLKSNNLSLPTTYADLVQIATVLGPLGIQTLMLPDADRWPSQSCLFSTLSGRYLGDGFIDGVKAKTAKFTDQSFVDLLTFYQKMFTDGVLDAADMDRNYVDGPDRFAQGKAAFFIDGDWRVGSYQTDSLTGSALISPSAQASDFGIVNFPSLPAYLTLTEKNPGTVSAIAGVGLGVSNALTGTRLEAAKRLLSWYYGKEFQTMQLERGSYLPSRMDVTSLKVEPLTPKVQAFHAAVSGTTYVLDGVLDPSVYDLLNNGLRDLARGTQTPSQVATALQNAQDSL